MNRVLAIITVCVLYGIFSIAACFAGVFGLVGTLVTIDADYISRIWRQLDRLLAVMLGWDGAKSVSAECGDSDCRFCRILCRILSVLLEPDHCKRWAREER